MNDMNEVLLRIPVASLPSSLIDAIEGIDEIAIDSSLASLIALAFAADTIDDEGLVQIAGRILDDAGHVYT